MFSQTHAGVSETGIPRDSAAPPAGTTVAMTVSPKPFASPETPSPMKNASRPALVAHDLISLQKGLVELVPELRGRACRLCGDPTTADDIVQDTVERALKFAKQYERGT